MKLTSSQKAILKTVDSKKKRKNAKAEFKLINRLKEMFENQDLDLSKLLNDNDDVCEIEVNYQYVCPESKTCSIINEIIKENPNDMILGKEIRRIFS